jgi:hypothetical protein
LTIHVLNTVCVSTVKSNASRNNAGSLFDRKAEMIADLKPNQANVVLIGFAVSLFDLNIEIMNPVQAEKILN